MADTDSSITRKFRVRFSQIDAARVIYYPRYLEIIADTFPEAEMDEAPFDLAIRFLQSNRLGDEIQMHLQGRPDGWSVSGSMDIEHFSVALTRRPEDESGQPYDSKLASFETEAFTLRDWMCGPTGHLHLSRYYELISDAIERWFESSVGMTFKELHFAREFGIPTVQMDTRCYSLPQHGEIVTTGLRPLSVGASAVQLTTWLAGAGNIMMETRQVLVFVELDDEKIRTVRIPGALRERIRAQLAAS